MTKKQRAQVVELLRCAADDDVNGTAAGLVGMFGAVYETLSSCRVEWLAWKILDAVPIPAKAYERPMAGCRDEVYRARLLEAAQRVEEGWTP